MKTLCVVVMVAGLSACASSNAQTVRLSHVWSTTCQLGGQSVVVSAPTLGEFHAAVEKAPECARGYTATAPAP
ncbi:hypothetical protein [Pararhodospirillum photometricum]|uniref:Lipoprotein n=1 Tax=Pararhodospirillum photometricum DSM 122 TaxID=1150469 RepID=H6SMI2_PARPM|nr:hypothetical protein [Pararhodospirillum photometricum]CCG09117.1 Putative uncharacterized protein [Pararhodospirillum photometricum DSM 122]